jgi:hypothetical protein
MVVAIRGHKYWLWRSVDQEGEVLDFLIQRRRCAKSAERLLRKLLKKARLRADADRHRQAEILPGCDPRDAIICNSRSRAAGEQPRGKLSSTSSTTRARTAAVQVARISATFPVHPRRRLQRFLRPTPSSETPVLQTVLS